MPWFNTRGLIYLTNGGSTMGKKRPRIRLLDKIKFWTKEKTIPKSIDSSNQKENSNKKILSWQLHEGSASQERSLVIGFDIGTACSKVVIQDQNIKKAYAIPFDNFGAQNNRYLLPTMVFINKDGKIMLESGESEQRNLKTNFLENPDQEVFKEKGISKTVLLRDLLAAYIGLALIEVRKWFKKNKRNDYKHINIEWQLNVGLPSLSYNDQKLLRNFKLVALSGWNISLLTDNEVYLPTVKSAVAIAEKQLEKNTLDEDEGQLHPELIGPIPEIIASVLGYVNSPLRQNGMYMMVDVGASTLDVSTFILHNKDEENVYSILWPDIQRLGAFVLHQRRIDESALLFQKKIKSLECLCDGISPLPDITQYLPEPSKDDYECVRQCDLRFLEECSRCIRSVIGITKKRRNPLSEAWSSGLPVFLCGGGSKIELYRSILPHAANRLAATDFRGFNIKNLPKPTNLEAYDMPPAEYHRIAVAYGLSFPGFDIGKIIPPRDIKDIEWHPTIKDIDLFFVDKDMA